MFQKWLVSVPRSEADPSVVALIVEGALWGPGKGWLGGEHTEHGDPCRNWTKIVNEDSSQRFIINAFHLQCVLYLNILFAACI